MITVVQGKLGAGKSYDVVRLCVDHLGIGGVVATNIRLDRDAVSQACSRRLSYGQFLTVSEDSNPREIPIGDRRGRGRRRVMVVLDEALNWFASSTSKEDPRKIIWGEWLRQSDKLGQDVFFIAQNFERTAKWIRELAQVCRDVSAIRQISLLGLFPLWYLCPPLRNCYVVRPYDVHLKQRLTFELHRYSSKIFACYDTSETYGFSATSSAFDNFVIYPAYKPPVLVPLVCLFLGLASCVGVTRIRLPYSRLSPSVTSLLP